MSTRAKVIRLSEVSERISWHDQAIGLLDGAIVHLRICKKHKECDHDQGSRGSARWRIEQALRCIKKGGYST